MARKPHSPKTYKSLITADKAVKMSEDEITSHILFYKDIILTEQEFMFCEFVSVGTPALRAATNAGYKSASVPRANAMVRQCMKKPGQTKYGCSRPGHRQLGNPS